MIVTTISGIKAPRKKTRLIQGDYYLIGNPKIKDSGDCYQINGRYYRVTTNYIAYDYKVGSYVIDNADLLEGIVNIENNGKHVIGKFSGTLNEYPQVLTSEGSKLPCLDENLLIKNPYYKQFRNSPNLPKYAHISMVSVDQLYDKYRITKEFQRSFDYNVNEDMSVNINQFNKDRRISKVAKVLNKGIMGKFSYGLEFETVKGCVPLRESESNGLIPLRDGSVGGLEYATIPLSGEVGIQGLLDSIDSLRKFTEYDKTCSLHLHIGNIPREEKFMVALFKIMYLVQDEIFNMFPIYKKYNFSVKRKLYTAPLPSYITSCIDSVLDTDEKVSKSFGMIYKYLSCGQEYEEVDCDLENVLSHPRDPEENRKWEVYSRYHFFNMIPLIFTNKQTVEFRIHTPTNSKIKIVNYIMICSAIVEYCINNTNRILNNTRSVLGKRNLLEYILFNTVFLDEDRSFSSYILDYVHSRKRHTYDETSKGILDYDEDDISFHPYPSLFSNRLINTNVYSKINKERSFIGIEYIKQLTGVTSNNNPVKVVYDAESIRDSILRYPISDARPWHDDLNAVSPFEDPSPASDNELHEDNDGTVESNLRSLLSSPFPFSLSPSTYRRIPLGQYYDIEVISYSSVDLSDQGVLQSVLRLVSRRIGNDFNFNDSQLNLINRIASLVSHQNSRHIRLSRVIATDLIIALLAINNESIFNDGYSIETHLMTLEEHHRRQFESM